MRARAWACLLLALCSCGPGLAQQRELGALSHAALLRCRAERAHCAQAKVCALAVQAAVDAIQTAQEVRARGEVALQVEASARAAEARARAQCSAGGMP